jgi:hypothetical protein
MACFYNRLPCIHDRLPCFYHGVGVSHHRLPILHHRVSTFNNRLTSYHQGLSTLYHRLPAYHHRACTLHHRLPTSHHIGGHSVMLFGHPVIKWTRFLFERGMSLAECCGTLMQHQRHAEINGEVVCNGTCKYKQMPDGMLKSKALPHIKDDAESITQATDYQ